ncbi:MAG: serine hydrolase domain-containing protein [Gemmatimonadales bacterium]|nr:serine hydrolase domain-containing protein [Gemmatimonadales bacterium]
MSGRRLALALLAGALHAMTGAAAAQQQPPSDRLVAAQAAAMLRETVPTDGPGVAVVVARGDRVLYRGARGQADLELAVPLTADHVFRVGSITKMFTAAAVLSLVVDGRIGLDDSIARFLPNYPGGEAILIRQLLDHTAGVSDAWDGNPVAVLETREQIERIGAAVPDFPPGAAWSYSNSGYILLGAVLESAAGAPWHAVIGDRLIRPLGLAHTGYYGDTELVAGRVPGYSTDEHGVSVRSSYISMTGPAAAGALSSTVDDLFRFMRALSTGRVLPPPLYDRMARPSSTAMGATVPYGLGLMPETVRGVPVVGHNGGINGFASQLIHFPDDSVTVVVLANSDAGPVSPRSLARRLGALAIGKPYRVLAPAAVDLAALLPLAGSYRIDGRSTRTLALQDGQLMSSRDNGPARRLALTDDGILFFPGDATDYFYVVKDGTGRVVALDYHGDGMPTPRRETRLPGRATPK